ncbi:MAG TPA: hypothetical protein VIL31_14500 [Cyclobacteriaceae bacterium]|jgi:hypothetical protein|nr:hypothetical protein [Cyclobacteriaceae bacterium]
MKTIICLSFVLAVAVACNVEPGPASQISSSEELAKRVITALQHESSEEYVALFPTIKEFHQLMDDNADFYGESLSDAKEEFAALYERNLTRSVQESFDRIVRQGRNSGIVWNTIRFERIDNTGQTGHFAQASLVISFTANGKQQRLILKKILILNSQWKVSQFIELV